MILNINKRIPITDDMLSFVKEIANKIAEKKLKESSYRIDNKDVAGRFTTGLLGECAVFQYLGYPYQSIDSEIVESSSMKDLPDLRGIGYDVGVKSVQTKNGIVRSPLIKKYNTYGQFICIVSEQFDFVDILGFLDADELNNPKNHNDNGILDPRARSKGTKTALSDDLLNTLLEGKKPYYEF